MQPLAISISLRKVQSGFFTFYHPRLEIGQANDGGHAKSRDSRNRLVHSCVLESVSPWKAKTWRLSVSASWVVLIQRRTVDITVFAVHHDPVHP